MTRRAFLTTSCLTIANTLAVVRPARPAPVREGGFEGSHAGAERQVESLRLCWCPPGSFRMGSLPTERGHRPDEAQADVTLSRGFWMARFEVSQGEWRRIAGPFPDRAPSAPFGEGDDYPVYWVSYEQAEEFCRALTSRAHRNGALPVAWAFDLPTEAQWEYACRAGTTTATAFGETLDPTHANFDPEAETRSARLEGGAHPVGSYPANAWGLHDMHGNVWEWCRDYYHARLPGGVDPDLFDRPGMRNRDGSYSRVRRGGAWIEPEWACRSAARLRYEPYRSSDHIGFRVVAVPLPGAASEEAGPAVRGEMPGAGVRGVGMPGRAGPAWCCASS